MLVVCRRVKDKCDETTTMYEKGRVEGYQSVQSVSSFSKSGSQSDKSVV